MSKQLPLVSAVVTAYNYERYLAEALDSALAQDYPADRLEIIVVDDGSTDGTPALAQRYANEHPGRVRYVRQPNAGLAVATTRGVEEARGDLITLLDADDAWLASRTHLLVSALARNPDAGLAYGDMEVIDGDGQTLAESWLEDAQQTPFRGRVAAHLLRSNFVIAPSLMIRAELRERFCPIPSSFPAQDWYVAARVAEVAEVEFVPAVVARYRRHGSNMSHGKDSVADIAKLFRRDVGMRRWMLANLRAEDLTVEQLADAYDYFWQTLLFVARTDHVQPESIVEVSEANRERAALQLSAGRAALSQAGFVAAASHFLRALSSDPFDPRAREGLEHARRRLVVPEARRPQAAAGRRRETDYYLRPDYTSRPDPEYFVDLADLRDWPVGEPDVYARAAEVATRLGASRIIDLGAGAGGKLIAPRHRFEILGLDYGPNVELARRLFPAGIWIDHDLDGPGPLPLAEDRLRGSVVICANVIEHLLRPEHLLENLREILPSVEALVISTPDRDLSPGTDDFGPPADATRVREWNIQEFAALLEAFGFEHGDLGVIPADDGGRTESTICAILYPDVRRAGRVAAGHSVTVC
jgi:glycosyltransferase involved in cell wall biosynthesis